MNIRKRIMAISATLALLASSAMGCAEVAKVDIASQEKNIQSQKEPAYFEKADARIQKLDEKIQDKQEKINHLLDLNEVLSIRFKMAQQGDLSLSLRLFEAFDKNDKIILELQNQIVSHFGEKEKLLAQFTDSLK